MWLCIMSHILSAGGSSAIFMPAKGPNNSSSSAFCSRVRTMMPPSVTTPRSDSMYTSRVTVNITVVASPSTILDTVSITSDPAAPLSILATRPCSPYARVRPALRRLLTACNR